MPTDSRLNRAMPSLFIFVRSEPATITCPDVARSSPPIKLSRVDLPDPDLPRIAMISPCGTSRVIDLQRRDSESARAVVGLLDVDELNRRYDGSHTLEFTGYDQAFLPRTPSS